MPTKYKRQIVSPLIINTTTIINTTILHSLHTNIKIHSHSSNCSYFNCSYINKVLKKIYKFLNALRSMIAYISKFLVVLEHFLIRYFFVLYYIFPSNTLYFLNLNRLNFPLFFVKAFYSICQYICSVNINKSFPSELFTLFKDIILYKIFLIYIENEIISNEKCVHYNCKNFETNQCSILDRNVIQVNIFVKKVSMSLNFNEIINDFYCIFEHF
ncbi:hypothetical protein AGLY_002342 [Aphis glycines]|uniref:Uncharacterized protein n=1 Tax=Aphis glycines TaxID=307491 RepID=A0A6G0U5I5_APHGL|nr:hypothetical protein AGLY_002342 [Aphis glycines]